MNLRQVLTIARREYRATVRRKAFLFTAVGTPLYFAFVMFMAAGPATKAKLSSLRDFNALAVVDSTGLFHAAPATIETDLSLEAPQLGKSPVAAALPSQLVHTHVSFYPDMAAADRALRANQVNQVLVIPPDYLERGVLRRYARTTNVFSGAEARPIGTWLVQGMVGRELDSLHTARIARPTRGMEFYAINRAGAYELKDDKRDMVDFMLPFMFAILVGLAITVGGQYLLQGVSEEKDSRILESMLCTISAEELLGGKLVGLGAAGLTMVAIWIAMAIPTLGSGMLLADVHLPVAVMAVALLYFLLAYLFYGSLMTGIGSVTSSMREAQQFSVMLSFLNFAPLIMMTPILARPSGPLATALSMFPPTAASTMMLRMLAPSSVVPAWQLATSLALLGGAAWIALRLSARVFRVGLLMYGKTPNLPEIMRWAFQK